MKYEDERIVALRRRERKKLFDSIEKGIYVKEQLYTFREVFLFHESLRIMLPNGFHIVPAKDVRYKYPSEFRPQVIISNELGKINFTFSEFDQTMQWEQLSCVLHDLQTAILNLHPSVFFFILIKKR